MFIVDWISTFSVIIGLFFKHSILTNLSSPGSAFCSKLTNASKYIFVASPVSFQNENIQNTFIWGGEIIIIKIKIGICGMK